MWEISQRGWKDMILGPRAREKTGAVLSGNGEWVCKGAEIIKARSRMRQQESYWVILAMH